MIVARDKALHGIKIGAPMQGTCGYQSTHAGWVITVPHGYGAMAASTAEEQLWKAGVRRTTGGQV